MNPQFNWEPTAHELRVLALMAEGLTNREIGDRLGCSEETIKTHYRRLRLRIGSRSRTHAVAIGFRRGWLK
jgi:two-component system NarL family response regulator